MNRELAKKKAQSRNCKCIKGKDRDNNYDSTIDEIFDRHEQSMQIIYNEMIQRLDFLHSQKNTIETEIRISELSLTIARLQQLLIALIK